MNKTSILISFIIPMYNVEKYIERCLNSILENNWGNSRFEIVVVDDESPDNSSIIVERYIKNNSNIKLIRQKNKGLGGARNTGILNAVGKYLFFLDSDDYLTKDEILTAVVYADKNDLDVLEFSANKVDEKYKVIDNIFQINCNEVCSGQIYIANYEFANSACNKLYKRLFLIKNEISFIEKVYVEDAPFNVEVLLKANKVSSIPNVVVSFLQNTESITRKRRTAEVLHKFINDSKIIIKKINKLNVEFSKNCRTKISLDRKIAMFLSGHLLMLIQAEKSFKEKKEEVDELIASGLYPVKSSSGIKLRDLFLSLFNNKRILLFTFFLRDKIKWFI